MSNRRRKAHREKDLTSRFLSGDWDEDRLAQSQRFSQRSKHAQHNKMLQTLELRAEEAVDLADLATLAVGQVQQVHSLYVEVIAPDGLYLCVVRKTLSKSTDYSLVVGDHVRIRPIEVRDEQGRPEAVIEQILPRQTLLTRADSFKQIEQHPIVANAQQMLIVAAIQSPAVRWGLIDRMLIAAEAGGLKPIICLNKIDLADPVDRESSQSVLDHYAGLGIRTLQTSIPAKIGIDALSEMLRDQTTVLAGHSGVGKSTLIRAIQPHLEIRIGDISHYTDKGRHTTTSARRYELDFGGVVIDTPGVKLFGLWGVTAENLDDFFPDVSRGDAPQWRQESHQRIAESLLG
jgi:ribosome biogenesis GTPase